MKLAKVTSSVILVVGFALIAFNNCAKVDFAKDSQAVKGSGGPSGPGGGGDGGGPGGDDPIKPPTQVIKTCATMKANGTLKSMDRKIVFEDTGIETGRKTICEFEQGENLSMKNEYLRARYTQSAQLNLPQGAVICGAEMQSPVQNFRYDDMFYFTFNDYVLASSLDRSVEQLNVTPVKVESSGKMIGMYKYEWLGVRNASFAGVNDRSNDYCLGEDEGHASCNWPLTEQSGQIKMQFDPEVLINIGLRPGGGPQRVGFVITGDNDPSLDCYHARFELDLKIYYYQ